MKRLKRSGRTAIVLAALTACSLSGCVRTSEGTPVAANTAARTGAAPAPATPPTDTGPPGIIPTSRAPLPLDTVTCAPPHRPGPTETAQIADPRAPRITVEIPGGWRASSGSGDVGARLDGPDDMSATVSITATELDPVAAFRQYADRITTDWAVSDVTVLPAKLCGYSGQKLLGAWSDAPQSAFEFRDRIVHIWTNAQLYLVAVHVQAPTGVTEFDPAASLLTEDFAVRIP